jgi:hypothetical protein
MCRRSHCCACVLRTRWLFFAPLGGRGTRHTHVESPFRFHCAMSVVHITITSILQIVYMQQLATNMNLRSIIYIFLQHVGAAHASPPSRPVISSYSNRLYLGGHCTAPKIDIAVKTCSPCLIYAVCTKSMSYKASRHITKICGVQGCTCTQRNIAIFALFLTHNKLLPNVGGYVRLQYGGLHALGNEVTHLVGIRYIDAIK